eukprot:8938861-Pyramimonas_sp.AAC.1
MAAKSATGGANHLRRLQHPQSLPEDCLFRLGFFAGRYSRLWWRLEGTAYRLLDAYNTCIERVNIRSESLKRVYYEGSTLPCARFGCFVRHRSYNSKLSTRVSTPF